ncbi:hypothetical protein DYB34_012074 [Aphanomyces astaci]|uniref:HTH CENPB-type domain-containing protein n=1 Tax=Aphanomyces astaci TaxID=112090 RepID=A0A3R7ALN4_APHAT|nr:hypothetical protein DYB34_012074 [Aphanomyces astaci]
MADVHDVVPSRRKGRPPFKYGKKAHVRLFKNKTVDYQHRLNVIHRVAEVGMSAFLDGYSANATPTQRDTTRKKVYGWMKQKDRIQEIATTARTAHHKCARTRGTGTTLPPAEEEQLARWVLGMRKDGIPVTYHMLRVMALETAIDVGLSEDEFKASWTWIQGFKRRHGLSLRSKTRIGQASTQDGTATLAEFSERVLMCAMANDVDVIYNADQTAVNYEYLPSKTLNPTKDNTVWVKCGGKTKERATAMLLADTTGKKHPLFLVMKSKKSKIKEVVQDNLTMRQGFGRQVWSAVEPLQERYGCRIFGNPTAWWNSGLSLAFLEYHFGRREGGLDKKVILLWDDFSAHFTDEVIAYAESINVILERVPPRFTWCCQPADVAWIRPLKATLRDRWLVEIRRQLRCSRAANQNLKLAGPSRSTMVEWITGAWNEVPESVILNGFRKCQLVDGAAVEVEMSEDSLDDGDIADLMADSAVEETIDPAQDIDAVGATSSPEIVSL